MSFLIFPVTISLSNDPIIIAFFHFLTSVMGDNTDRLSRRTVLKATGSVGFAAVGLRAMSGTASANCSGSCEPVELGKIDSDDTDDLEPETTSEFTLTLNADQRIADDCDACQGDEDITVQVTPTETKDGGKEVTEVELNIDDANGACKCADDGLYFSGAKVKGGPKVATYDCSDTDDANQDFSSIPEAAAPVNPNNGKRYGISNIVIEVCVFESCYVPGETFCVNDGGS